MKMREARTDNRRDNDNQEEKAFDSFRSYELLSPINEKYQHKHQPNQLGCRSHESSGNIIFLTGNIMRHPKFISRTVLVRNGDVDEAVRVLNSIMAKEGWFDQWRRTRFYEKPTWFRSRINFEIAKSLYDEDMSRKIKFILRKNRVDPFPGHG